MLFDSHAHLNDPKLFDNIEEILERAKQNKVDRLTCVGYDYDSSMLAIQIANKYSQVYAAIGIHPSEAKSFDMNIDWIEENLNNTNIVAIGEIGLDYYWDKTYKEEQKQLFIQQIKLANKHHKPIIIHMRDATKDTYDLLKEHKKASTTGVMHCYSSSKEAMQQFIDLNMYISLAGPVTFKNAHVPKEVAKEISLDHLLVETDCPYLAPTPYRGKINEPKNVLYIAEEIARIKGISLEEVMNKTYENTCNMYNIK